MESALPPSHEVVPMPYRSRFTVVPQLEVIRASDDTVRAELISLPVIRTPLGDATIQDPAAARVVAGADGAAGPPAA